MYLQYTFNQLTVLILSNHPTYNLPEKNREHDQDTLLFLSSLIYPHYRLLLASCQSQLTLVRGRNHVRSKPSPVLGVCFEVALASLRLSGSDTLSHSLVASSSSIG